MKAQMHEHIKFQNKISSTHHVFSPPSQAEPSSSEPSNSNHMPHSHPPTVFEQRVGKESQNITQ
jgi:hypothetical protein